MKSKAHWILLLLVGVISGAQAVTYTATNNAGWNTATTWDPNGVPGSADMAVIPVGKTVTYGGTPSIVGAVQISGRLSVSRARALGDVWIHRNGTLNPTAS